VSRAPREGVVPRRAEHEPRRKPAGGTCSANRAARTSTARGSSLAHREPEVHAVRAHARDRRRSLPGRPRRRRSLPYNFLVNQGSVLSPHQRELWERFRGGPSSIPTSRSSTDTGLAARTGRSEALHELHGGDLRVPRGDGRAALQDTANRPMPETGWSPERARHFGAGCVDAIALVIDRLRV
jgi:hypothetical protein